MDKCFSMGQKTEITCVLDGDIISIDSVTSDLQGMFIQRHLEIIKLKDEMVKSALIKAGWTPPRDADKRNEGV